MTEAATLGPQVGSAVKAVGIGATMALVAGAALARGRRLIVTTIAVAIALVVGATAALAYPPDPCSKTASAPPAAHFHGGTGSCGGCGGV